MDMRVPVAAAVFFSAVALTAQDAPAPAASNAAASGWTFKHKIEIRGNYRKSNEQRFQLRFPFPGDFLPPGATAAFLETVDSGAHAELSVAQLQLDASYGHAFFARAKLHAVDKYRRNPTSEDRKMDADELYVQFGEAPAFLERPAKTSFFLLAGKAPKVERQPIRLLESYGLAATAFNRFEDVGFIGGGSVGRNLYWRLSATTGNPLYFRDPNALAGDNGVKALLQRNPDPKLKSGFPILYNAETEGYFLKTGNVQYGQALGYRWQNAAETFGFDAVAFHYKRDLADTQKLTGTFYGGDIDLLDGPQGFNISLPIHGRRKEEWGGRIYTEWHGLTTTAQFTKQVIAGLYRQGYELETGYEFKTPFGPNIGGQSFFQSIQPAVRVSGLQNFFKGPKNFVDPSMWWNWTKIDYGVRVGFTRNVDVTIEHAKHNVVAPKKLDLSETLVTVRVRV
jgi:hypothetical protein